MNSSEAVRRSGIRTCSERFYCVRQYEDIEAQKKKSYPACLYTTTAVPNENPPHPVKIDNFGVLQQSEAVVLVPQVRQRGSLLRQRQVIPHFFRHHIPPLIFAGVHRAKRALGDELLVFLGSATTTRTEDFEGRSM